LLLRGVLAGDKAAVDANTPNVTLDQIRLVKQTIERIEAATANVEKSRPAAPPPPRPSRVLVEYSKDTGKRGPDWMNNNVDPVLGLNFSPNPRDPAWKQITAENVAAYQLWFQRAVLRAELYNAYSSDSLVGDRAEAVGKTAFEAKAEHGLVATDPRGSPFRREHRGPGSLLRADGSRPGNAGGYVFSSTRTSDGSRRRV
jgi:hypothetical protein